jgi:hypothetical protein
MRGAELSLVDLQLAARVISFSDRTIRGGKTTLQVAMAELIATAAGASVWSGDARG